MDWEDCSVNGIATFGCVPLVFSYLINAAFIFCGVVALFFIIWSGINMTTTGGDQKKVESAKRILTYAIIGLTVVLLSFGIIFFIGYTTGTTSCITNFTDMKKFLIGCQ